MGTLKILMIEDNELIFNLLEKKILRHNQSDNMQVHLESSLKRGHENYLKNNYNALLLDLNLPDSSGFNTLKQALKLFDIPILVLSSIDKDNDVALDCVRIGAQDFIRKKVLSPEDIYQRILYAIIRHEKTQK